MCAIPVWSDRLLILYQLHLYTRRAVGKNVRATSLVPSIEVYCYVRNPIYIHSCKYARANTHTHTHTHTNTYIHTTH